MSSPHEKYFDAWRASVLRSTIVLKAMLGQEPVAKSARCSVEEIVRQTNLAILAAASAEMMPQVNDGLFVGENPGVTKSRDPDAWPLRSAELDAALTAAGYEKSFAQVEGEDVVVFRRGADEVVWDREGEWVMRDGHEDETRAGDELRDLQRLLREED